jgi:hypothetical protein
VTVVVNGAAKDVDVVHLTYAEVVILAGSSGSPSVTYLGPPHGDSRRSGTVYPGCPPVLLEHGMVFEVVHTSGA